MGVDPGLDRTTGWTKDGNRYYSSTVGRWTQQDTLDAPFDAANANRYEYAGDNPVNCFDPLGQFSFKNLAGDLADAYDVIKTAGEVDDAVEDGNYQKAAAILARFVDATVVGELCENAAEAGGEVTLGASVVAGVVACPELGSLTEGRIEDLLD